MTATDVLVAPEAMSWSAAVDAVRARAWIADPGSLARSAAELVRARSRSSFTANDAACALRDAARTADRRTAAAIRKALRLMAAAEAELDRPLVDVVRAVAAAGRDAR
jgi:hypothetical protein